VSAVIALSLLGTLGLVLSAVHILGHIQDARRHDRRKKALDSFEDGGSTEEDDDT
jgi:hypothetical protein